MLDHFAHLLPEVIFEAVETLGGRATGRFLVLHAFENRVYDVEIEGEPNRVIKFYRPSRWTKDVILAEHRFLATLHENEIPVVCPLTGTDGQTLFESNGIYFTVFPKKAGRLEPELSKEQLKRLGRFLARIHNVGSTLKNEPRLTLTPQYFGRDSADYLANEKRMPENLATKYRDIAHRICDFITPLFTGIETVLLHGDCHAGNVLWDKDNPFFIDFDDMIYAPPVQDIWMLTGADDSYGIEMRNLLLSAYQEMRSFDDETLNLIEPLRTLRMIHFSKWIAMRWNDEAFKTAFPNFGTERYWQEQIETLYVQWEKMQGR